MSDVYTPIVLATPHERHDQIEASLRARPGLKVTRIRRPEDLAVEHLSEIAPRYIFFPHWSWVIPESVFEAFECIVFHMTDLPFGRGGSPLQNLISQGIYETKLTALRCERVLDAGPIYVQKDFSLHGGAEEILLRAARLVEKLIIEILERHPVPKPQVGEPILFQRRKPSDGNIGELDSLGKTHDFIRMLDAKGYPPAFLEIGKLRLEFSRSRLDREYVLADVRITIVPDKEST